MNATYFFINNIYQDKLFYNVEKNRLWGHN